MGAAGEWWQGLWRWGISFMESEYTPNSKLDPDMSLLFGVCVVTGP